MKTYRRYNEKANDKHVPFIQPKLNIGKPGDKYEVEADAMANKVVNANKPQEAIQKTENTEEEVQQKPLAASVTPLVQKQAEASDEETVQTKCTECDQEEMVQRMEEEEEVLQTKSNESSIAPTNIESSLKNSKGSGQRLSKPVKQNMESSFGADFSQVNIHTDNNAVQMSKQINAQAFTHGNDIYFNKGKYNPSSNNGKHLLAHELTHTIQQDKSNFKIQRQTRTPREIAQDRITTPIPVNAQIPRRANRATFNVNGIQFTLLPDNRSGSRRMRNRAVTNIRQRVRGPRPVIRSQRVARVRNYRLSYSIRTTYGQRTNSTVPSGYGRGTTRADIAAGRTTLGFHEGNHGLDYMRYVTNNSPPQFNGAVGMTRRQFNREIRILRTALRNYFRDLNQYSIANTDCVGTTIDQANGTQECTIP